jgi:hypothetical protein
MKINLLVYDIPSALDYDNPSGQLRRVGFRVNLSCWAVTEESTPWNLLEEFTTLKIDWKLFPFASDATPSLIQACREAIVKELADAGKRNDEALADSMAKHLESREAEDEKTRHKGDKRYEYSTKNLITRANQLLDDLESAARCFGIDPATLTIAGARDSVKALTLQATTKAHLYANMTHLAAGTAMESAAQDNAVPAGILADFVEETTGNSMTEVREAFRPTQPTTDQRDVRSATTPATGRQYTVTGRNGTILSCTSTMTTSEAAAVCRGLSDRFASDLGRRFLNSRLSTLQQAWLHVLANRSEVASPVDMTTTSSWEYDAATKTIYSPSLLEGDTIRLRSHKTGDHRLFFRNDGGTYTDGTGMTLRAR